MLPPAKQSPVDGRLLRTQTEMPMSSARRSVRASGCSWLGSSLARWTDSGVETKLGYVLTDTRSALDWEQTADDRSVLLSEFHLAIMMAKKKQEIELVPKKEQQATLREIAMAIQT